MIPTAVSRVDLHCHSTASEIAKLGVQRSIGLPECATPPEEVYSLAKRRGMDFVTITDHDTIDGALTLADRPDCFVSEELTAWFAGEPQAVHILCYGITEADHEYLQAHARDLEVCAEYLRENRIACALAHPFFTVAAPLEPRHRRRLADLFSIWETRNGARSRELNQPAAFYVETHGGVGIAGSDDHGGIDIGRTFTETPPAATPAEFLDHLRAGRASGRGAQGSAAKWAHSAIAIAIRSLLGGANSGPREKGIDPRAVLEIAERVVADGGARGGAAKAGLGAAEARALLRGWLDSIELGAEPSRLIEMMQADDFHHGDFARRVKRIHERRLREAVSDIGAAGTEPQHLAAATAVFGACVPAIPYVPATTILGKEVAKLMRRDGERRRVALIADGGGAVHGLAHTIERIRDHGVPGWDVEVIGTDPRVDRRLPSVAEVAVPFYEGIAIGVPSVPELVSTIVEGHYDLIHLTAPGPAGISAALTARIGGTPVCGSYHTELAAYARMRTGDPRLEGLMRAGLSLFYRDCASVLSPSPAADESLGGLGIEPDRIVRWTRGVDLDSYGLHLRDSAGYPGEFKILYAGRLTREKGIDLLADSFLAARERDPRLHLLLAGGGPDEHPLRVRLGEHATFLGWLDRDQLARAYASADLFLFCSQTDTYGQVISEAQASGLPVVAVAKGGPSSLIRDRHSGWLCEADPQLLASAVAQLASSEFLRQRLARIAREDVRSRTWDAALTELALGYERALASARRKPQPAPLRQAA